MAFDDTWPELVAAIADSFRLSDEERGRFAHNAVAKLIGAIPFLAGCGAPERTALDHLSTYLLACRDGARFFHASPEDDVEVMRRLDRIATFSGGDRMIVDRGMNLLALCMLGDYQRDIDEDRDRKYNPVASGAFDYDLEVARLQRRIAEVNSPDMDEILSADDAVRTWWQE